MELTGRRFGHIRVAEVVGQGGMGDVYAGYDEKLERKVALKVLNSDQRLDAEARERLLREARALSKLEHPNICRIHDYIETGEVDLLVLEYIDGKTLDDVMHHGLARAEKLRIARALAEVLVQAHRAGIVHRDLKPENVMLTKSGQVKVLDFGLARWLHRRRESGRNTPPRLSVLTAAAGSAGETLIFPNVPSTPTGHSDPQMTAVGITLGTPLYMSPEQARGETLTPASDMFSFGLLLQVLFTGQEPHPAPLTAREVILRVARGETTPVQGAPRDITAVINRLKQLAPADRPTAIETAERLRLLDEKPQRIARRAAGAALALLALLGAWRYTVDLQSERALALDARLEAERRRAQAENLIEFMLGDLREKLEPVGRLDILDDAAQRSLGYFKSLDIETLSGADLIRNAKALHQLGDVRIAQGKLDDAMIAFERSLALSSAALRRQPKDPEAQLAVGTSHYWLGNAYRLRSDLPHTLGHWTAYMRTAEALSAAHPKNDEYRLERAYGHGNVATALEMQGDLRGALHHNRITLRIKKERLESDPVSASRRADYATSLNKVGSVLYRLGDLQGALTQFEGEFAIISALAAEDPSHARLKQTLATCRSFIAALHESMGRDDQALTQRLAELEIARGLHVSDPANVTWQRNLATAATRLADLKRRGGDLGHAARLAAEAESLMRDLVSRPSPRPMWRRDLAVARIAAARVHLANGNASPAAAAAQEAAQLLVSAPSDLTSQRFLAEAHLVRGDALAAAGRRDDAHVAWTLARSVAEPAARGTTEPSVLDIHVRTVVRAGGNAKPLLDRLERLGYRHRDLVSLVQQSRRIAA